ncbi:2-amino-4-hydroxy-6-hydroxymethyldihydropteridine diphosphokinase [Cellulomonas marina]|uniref:Bifunctional folate synthesis protein n=1 Tax=Cellulomonas marina TaxID=988821 RepID=A0A1I0WPA0_9CELL|nr:2-amino-4-hydroxy-6-hydroxymethyldihydropteridine diphosphokinase [Cellulomonas marina]GIG27746.1 hypothetical protein Cma02nite_03460 [Cellulomonas marina]SFA89806.1 dihydroneopterin aldolase / 2-amino-4-hydroxy-6-hydroxymethyldihydropteridine diphosphokinase [Cellulomonas marina]
MTHGPVLDPAGRPLDQIRLTGVSATGHHGVFDHERRDGQTFVADVVVHLDTRPAARGDALAATVHYGELAQAVSDVLTGSPADLIETVAERIAAVALAHPAAVAVDVAVHKPSAPIPVPFDDVVVAVRRDRVLAPPVVPAGDLVPPPEADPLPEPVPDAAPQTVPDPLPDPLPDALPDPLLPEPVTLVATDVHAVDHPDRPDGGPLRADDADDDAVVEAEVVEDALDRRPAEPVDVVLAIGANLGAAQETLRQAVADLDAVPGLEVLEVSPLARTAAVGGPEQPDYLNAVLLGRTTLAPRELLHAVQRVEQGHGRVRLERWGPRTLDVDVVAYGTVVAATDDLELPHPRAHQRAFVLAPWAQVDPHAVLPGLGGGPVAALAATAPDRAGVRWMALDWLTSPVTVVPPPAPGEG